MDEATATLDNDVRLLIYRALAESGRPPLPAAIAAAVGVSSAEAEASLRRLAEAHVLVLAPGTPYVWMANPFSALPTPFEVNVDGRDYYGSCIWDALGLIGMLGDEGVVSTRCPDCGDDLALRVRAGELEATDYVVHYAVPAARWWDDIGFA